MQKEGDKLITKGNKMAKKGISNDEQFQKLRDNTKRLAEVSRKIDEIEKMSTKDLLKMRETEIGEARARAMNYRLVENNLELMRQSNAFQQQHMANMNSFMQQSMHTAMMMHNQMHGF